MKITKRITLLVLTVILAISAIPATRAQPVQAEEEHKPVKKIKRYTYSLSGGGKLKKVPYSKDKKIKIYAYNYNSQFHVLEGNVQYIKSELEATDQLYTRIIVNAETGNPVLEFSLARDYFRDYMNKFIKAKKVKSQPLQYLAAEYTNGHTTCILTWLTCDSALTVRTIKAADLDRQLGNMFQSEYDLVFVKYPISKDKMIWIDKQKFREFLKAEIKKAYPIEDVTVKDEDYWTMGRCSCYTQYDGVIFQFRHKSRSSVAYSALKQQ